MRAVSPGVVGSTEARPVEATAVWLVAPANTVTDAAIHSSEAVVAVALFAPVVADTVAAATIGAGIDLGLTLQTNEASGAQAVSAVALSAILFAILLACLLCAGRALKSNLAQACGVVPTVTILAIRANRLRAVNGTVANIALTLSGNTIAATVARAAIGAHLLLTRLAHEARCAIAHTIHAAPV